MHAHTFTSGLGALTHTWSLSHESQATIESDAQNTHRVRHRQVDIRDWCWRQRWHRSQLCGCAHEERFGLVWIQLESVLNVLLLDVSDTSSASEMTYIVSDGAFNSTESTHSLTQWYKRREWRGRQICCRRASLDGAECHRRIDGIGRHGTRWCQRLECNTIHDEQQWTEYLLGYSDLQGSFRRAMLPKLHKLCPVL